MKTDPQLKPLLGGKLLVMEVHVLQEQKDFQSVFRIKVLGYPLHRDLGLRDRIVGVVDEVVLVSRGL